MAHLDSNAQLLGTKSPSLSSTESKPELPSDYKLMQVCGNSVKGLQNKLMPTFYDTAASAAAAATVAPQHSTALAGFFASSSASPNNTDPQCTSPAVSFSLSGGQ